MTANSISQRNLKGRLIVASFRFVHSLSRVRSRNLFSKLIYIVFGGMYRITIEWILGVEIPPKTKIGKNLTVYHGQGIVINDNTVIGDNVTIRHNTTIGNKGFGTKSPIIGNNVDIGSNVVIIGDIVIGDNVTIGAGSVVVKSIPAGKTYAGNPAKEINK